MVNIAFLDAVRDSINPDKEINTSLAVHKALLGRKVVTENSYPLDVSKHHHYRNCYLPAVLAKNFMEAFHDKRLQFH